MIWAEGQLGAALADLRAVAENYPSCAPPRTSNSLLAQIECQIQAARNVYNADVQAYNTKIQIFPTRSLPSRAG